MNKDITGKDQELFRLVQAVFHHVKMGNDTSSMIDTVRELIDCHEGVIDGYLRDVIYFFEYEGCIYAHTPDKAERLAENYATYWYREIKKRVLGRDVDPGYKVLDSKVLEFKR